MDFQQIRDFVNPAVAQATGMQEVENLSMPVPVAYVPVQLVIDGALSLTSENPVQNKVIAVAIQNLDGRITAVEGQFSAGVTEAVNNWLAAHPEATTTVQDGAITYAKLDANLKGEVDQISDLKSTIKANQIQLLEVGNLNSSDGNTKVSTAYVRTVDYLDIGTLTVNKPANVGMTIFYYNNPTEINNGFIGTAQWGRSSAKSGVLYNESYPNATHVKMRFDITGINPITIEDIVNAGLQIEYLVHSAELAEKIKHIDGVIDIAYTANQLPNTTTTLATLKECGVYAGTESLSANISDIPVHVAFTLINLNIISGYYRLQVFVTKIMEIYTRIVATDTGAIYKDWVKRNNPEFESSILNGKKWVACGDSFTHGDFTGIDDPADYTFQNGLYQGQNMVYPFFIGNRTGCTVINEAINGSHMGYKEGRGDKNFSAPNGRYTQIPSDADYITLYFGINDGPRHQNIPIGTIDDTTNETFYGAWNVVMQYLITHHPNAKIGIIISNGCDTIDYPNAEIAIAKKYGIAYFDMNGDPKIPFVFRTNGKPDLDPAILAQRNSQYCVGGGNAHPNVACHKDESTFIQAWLERI